MLESRSTSTKLKWHQQILLTVVLFIFRIWGRTLRFHFKQDVRALLASESPPKIWVFWHNRLLASSLFWMIHAKHRLTATMISTSSDGNWIAALTSKIGVQPIRGSRHNRGAQAVREMIQAQQRGFDISITPDGSRGPMYDMKPGAVMMALKSASPIVLTSFNFSKAWRLNSWDRLFIPYPFSRIEVQIDEIQPKSELSPEKQEATAMLKERMDAITNDRE